MDSIIDWSYLHLFVSIACSICSNKMNLFLDRIVLNVFLSLHAPLSLPLVFFFTKSSNQQNANNNSRTIFRLKAINVMPPSWMSSDFIDFVLLLRDLYMSAISAMENEAIYGDRVDVVVCFRNRRIVRSHEKVAVCQNLGLNVDEMKSPETQQGQDFAGGHCGLCDCHAWTKVPLYLFSIVPLNFRRTVRKKSSDADFHVFANLCKMIARNNYVSCITRFIALKTL